MRMEWIGVTDAEAHPHPTCRSVIILSRGGKHSLENLGRSSRWLELGFADHWIWIDNKIQKWNDLSGSPLLVSC
jgi:hypothetical protein